MDAGSDEDSASPSVITAVRVRPMSDDERKAGCRLIVAMDGNATIVTDPAGLHARGAPASPAHATTLWKQSFTYDKSYWSYDPSDVTYASQARLYEELGTHVLRDAWRGFNCSLFAYGQTGAGKSFSMMGKAKGNNNHSHAMSSAHDGLIPRLCHGLFEKIQAVPDDARSYLVKMSYVEIYNERVYDLLNRSDKDALKVREHPDRGAYVEHVSHHVVTSYHDIEYLLGEGAKTRRVAATEMNQVSSRSHAILTLSLRRELKDGQRVSKICMVDLAGSERTELAQGTRLREAAYINKSLSALGDVIHALATNVQTPGTSFVQFRNSILTRLLKDSLCGQSKLVMLAAISPCCIHYDETMSTLKYLERVKVALAHSSPPLMELTPCETDASVSTQLRLEILALRGQLRVAQQQPHRCRVEDSLGNDEICDDDAATEPETTGCHHLGVAHLVNLNQDPAFTETKFYCIEEGVTTVGRQGDGDVVPDIVLDGPDILPLHCVFHCNEDGDVSVRPALHASIYLNGKDLSQTFDACHVPNGSRVTLGAHHVFRFDLPHVALPSTSRVDWSFAHNELLETLLPTRSTPPSGSCDLGSTAPPDVLPATTRASQDVGINCCLPSPSQDVMDAAQQTDTWSAVACVSSASTQTVEDDTSIKFSENDKLGLERRIAKLKLELKKKERQLKAAPASNNPVTMLPVFEPEALPPPIAQPTTQRSTKASGGCANTWPRFSTSGSRRECPTQDDPAWRHAVLVDLETLVEAVPKPKLDAPLDASLLRIRNQLAANLELTLPPATEDPYVDPTWRTQVLSDIEAMVLAPPLPVTIALPPWPSSHASYAHLLESYVHASQHELSQLSHASSTHLGSYAKTIASLEAKFTSLCVALNTKCHQEQVHFQAQFQSTSLELARHVELKQTQLQAASFVSAQLLEQLQTSLQAQMDNATSQYQQQHEAWTNELQTFTKQHFDAMASCGAEAAFADEQARMQVAEWDTKCHHLVAETDAVLSETRAMHAKELRALREKAAIELRTLETRRMRDEEECMHATEAMLRAFEVTMATRAREQAEWETQKQDDLAALQAEHATAMSYLEAQHTSMYSQAREARELYGMAHEDARERWLATAAQLDRALEAAKAVHAVEMADAKAKAAKQHGLHCQKLAEAAAHFDARLAALDATAVDDSVAHARFMKSLRARQMAEESQLATTVHTSRALLAEQRSQLVWNAKEVRDAHASLHAEHQHRVDEMTRCHANIVRDLEAAFQMQEATRANELFTRSQQYEAELAARAQLVREGQASASMQIEDAIATHGRILETIEADWKRWVEAQTSAPDDPLIGVDERHAAYVAQQGQCDAEISALRQRCSDVERLEVERHKHVNEEHKLRLLAMAQTQEEHMSRNMMTWHDAESRTMNEVQRLQDRCTTQLVAIEREHAVQRRRLEELQDERRQQQQVQLGRIQANMDEVAFAHAQTLRDIDESHERQLEALRADAASSEEARMEAFESQRRRHEWAMHQVENAAQDEHTRCLTMLTDLARAHRETLLSAQQALSALDNDHREWVRAFEWQAMQASLNAREVEFQARVAQLRRVYEDDERLHADEAAMLLVAWTERLTCVHMETEDVRSRCVGEMRTLAIAHADAIEALERDHQHRAEDFARARAMAALKHQTSQWTGDAVSLNQQAFYDEACVALDRKWEAAVTEHDARMKASAIAHAQAIDVARLQHEAKLLEMQHVVRDLSSVFASALDRYKVRLDDRLAEARLRCSSEEASWREMVHDERSATLHAELGALKRAEETATQAHRTTMQATQAQWSTHVRNLEMEVEDIASFHDRLCANAKAAFDDAIRRLEARQASTETQTLREKAELDAMALAEAEVIAELQASMVVASAAANRARQAELQEAYAAQLRELLHWRQRRENLEATYAAEMDDLQSACLRLLQTTDVQPARSHMTFARRKLVQARVGIALAREGDHRASKEHETNLAAITDLAIECRSNMEMALEDPARALYDDDDRLDELDELEDEPAKVHPLEQAATFVEDAKEAAPSLTPLVLDPKALPALCCVRPALSSNEAEILHTLTLQGSLMERMEAERRSFKLRCDEYSRGMSKLQAALRASEEMAAAADAKARNDAETIALLQEKVKLLVVELPPSPTAVPLVLPKEATVESSNNTTLLRGWKS
ncbi:hypothetical protein SPRG_04676 [Saprolegnia parasitica CBS 223.65]|uniref:Kinesin motor domain-containing protein n=1 Tax=Saprolegnia parasitica (strain CBS 223.65) TaxID=695850 RepID=A0A067CNH0_SAPPC|nr:hypothetical protein SPRG_04676 [Saprolegnia parasitica CBS 223.65]KDO30775.1 hypothetical protein SPRG_04676 [Saprolegnia parasitica CBS 223.65]|eukprot:XP_012198473.1 hypothetical protein SPRG_04676 [Saprolegnia parasitica CBS 223.65]